MGKSGKLVVIAILLAALGAAGYFLSGAGGADPAPIGPASVGDDRDPGAITAPLRTDGDRPAEAVDAHGGRVEMAPDPVEDGMPESYRETLAGFVGRVVLHDQTPAADHRVLLYRFDLTSVVTPDASLFSDVRYQPDVDAGDARTDDEGRFEIRGVFPRGFLLLHAGVGSENPTAKIVQRIPGPGETVDLGDIVLKNGAVITGRILDSNGEPLAGALVRATDLPGQVLSFVPLERFDPEGAIIVAENGMKRVMQMPSWAKRRFDQLPIATTHSDSDGAFRLTGIDPGDNALLITAADHDSFINPRIKVGPGEERDVGTVEMREGEELYGRVVDQQNEPVAGAEVLIGQSSSMVPVALASHFGPTDAKGAFEALGFKPGKVSAAARRGPGDPWIIVDGHQVTRDLVIRLPSRHAMTLRLVSAAGREVAEPEFRVIAGSSNEQSVDMGMWGVAPSVRLDGRVAKTEDGRYRIDDLDAGSYTVLVRSPGHALSVIDVILPGDPEKTVTLRAQRAFEVVALDLRNKPVPDAAVYVMDRGPYPRVMNMPMFCGRTAASGRLLVDEAAVDKLAVSAWHPKYGRTHGEVDGPTRELRLVFADPGSIAGVLTEAGGPPELGKWMIAASPRRQGRAAMPQLPQMTLPDAEGNFSIRGLAPAEYELVVMKSLDSMTSPGALVQSMMRASFFDQNETRCVVVANQVTNVNLDAVKPPEVIDGPSAHVSGTVMVNGRPGAGMMITGWGNRRRIAAEVADNGTFDIGQVGEGQLHLQLSDPTKQDLAGRSQLWERNFKVVANEELIVTVDLETSSLSGLVYLPDGSPAANLEIRASGHFAATPGGEKKERANANFQTFTDGDGKFEFANVPAGVYTVTGQDKRGDGKASDVRVAAGVPTRGVEVRMTRVFSVSGTVELAALGKEPFEWAWLRVRPENSAGERTGGQARWSNLNKDGTFEINTLRPGRYSIEITTMMRRGDEHEQVEFVTDSIQVDGRDQEGVVLRPRPKPKPTPTQKKG